MTPDSVTDTARDYRRRKAMGRGHHRHPPGSPYRLTGTGIVNYEFFPRPKELTGGFAVDTDGLPRKGDTIVVGDQDVYEVAEVAWRFGSYESDNDGDLTVVVTCDLRT